MNSALLMARLRTVVQEELPLPGAGATPLRHRRLMEIARENLSLARLAEAHWDAISILAEAGRAPAAGALYGVWAAEIPGKPLRLLPSTDGLRLHGVKPFLSGAGLVDRALITVSEPEQQLIEVDLRRYAGQIVFDASQWKTSAFAETRTSAGTFGGVPIYPCDFVGNPGWYLQRLGFWNGACGPAACWAGGAAGLLDYALAQSRRDPHTLAHLAAIHANVWALHAYLDAAGRAMDSVQGTAETACVRALTLRHLVEQAATEVLRRVPRAYGPYPLAMDADVSRRYQELDLYLRQSHAERDLEVLGRKLVKDI